MIQFTENGVLQTRNKYEESWTAKTLFEKFEPLKFEPLATRHNAMIALVPVVEPIRGELTETGQRCLDFWKLLQPEKVPSMKFKYTTKVVDTYEWELKLTPKGLVYKDKSNDYSTYSDAYAQLFSDFWLYGPRMPIPDLSVREEVLAAIRGAFRQDGPVAPPHFPLFEYPPTHSKLSWNTNGGGVEDFIIVRNYGIEVGQTNWHDGLVFLDFISFEQFLTGQGLNELKFKPKVKLAIKEHLGQALKSGGN